MNAYELADYLDNNLDASFMSEQKYIDMAAEMLRKQAEQIKELKKYVGFKDSGYEILNIERMTK